MYHLNLTMLFNHKIPCWLYIHVFCHLVSADLSKEIIQSIILHQDYKSPCVPSRSRTYLQPLKSCISCSLLSVHKDHASKQTCYCNKIRKHLNLWPPLEWLACNFSLHYLPWITYFGHENKECDRHLKLLNVNQILFVSTLGNVWRTIGRIGI